MDIEKEVLEQACFMMIAFSGAAKSDYMEGLALAKKGQYDEAILALERGDDNFRQAHSAHFDLIQKEGSSENGLLARLLLVHAEDQMAMAETTKMFVQELIELYQFVKIKPQNEN